MNVKKTFCIILLFLILFCIVIQKFAIIAIVSPNSIDYLQKNVYNKSLWKIQEKRLK